MPELKIFLDLYVSGILWRNDKLLEYSTSLHFFSFSLLYWIWNVGKYRKLNKVILGKKHLEVSCALFSP